MKFICLQEHLAAGLSIVERAIGKAAHLPTLTHVLLETQEGKLKLAATDLEIGMTSWCQGKVEEEGKMTLPAKILASLVFSLAPEKVTLESQKENCLVISKSSRALIKGLSPEDFPLIPVVQNERPLTVETKKLLPALNRVIVSVATEASRAELNGVFFSLGAEVVNVVATDSFRLSRVQLSGVSTKDLAPQFFHEQGLIVPGKTIRELVRILDPEDPSVFVTVGENQIQFAQQRYRLVSRLIEGAYPRYEEIIPASYLGVRTFNQRDLVNTLKRAELFAGRTERVEFLLREETAEITSEDPALGSASEKISVEGEGPEIKLVFNIRYLLDGVMQFGGGRLRLEYNEPHTPVVFRSSDSEKDLYIVMPMKT